MGSKDRLDVAMDLQGDVRAAGGTDEDVAFVRERRPELFVDFGRTIADTARSLRIADGKFETWKKVPLGTHKDADSLKEAVVADGCRVGDYAADLMTQPAFALAPQERSAELVRVKVRDLGFTGNTSLRIILARGHQELGLNKCVPEVGPQLRRTYKDQPKGEVLWIAMDPIVDSNRFPRVLNVCESDGKLWLGARWSSRGDEFNPGDEFVFSK